MKGNATSGTDILDWTFSHPLVIKYPAVLILNLGFSIDIAGIT